MTDESQTEPVIHRVLSPPADWPGTPEEYSAAIDWALSQSFHVSFRGGGGKTLFPDPIGYLTAVLGRSAPPSTLPPLDPSSTSRVELGEVTEEDFLIAIYGRARRPPA